jgi:SAM-dependent methyltransferase
MSVMARLEGYEGRCAMCGWVGSFSYGDPEKAAGSAYPCGKCGTRLRYRDEAAVMVEEYADTDSSSLDELRSGVLADLAVHYVGVSGPLRAKLATLERFSESAFERPEGQGSRPCRRSYQDLQDLGFADSSFDLVVSSHVMEHIPDPDRAFLEVSRVLRSGGRYVFSMPMRPAGKTVARAAMRDGEIEHFEPEHFHNSPSGGALVFNDFGDDLVERLSGLGFAATTRRPTENMAGYLNAVVVARPVGGRRAQARSTKGEPR